MKRENIGDQIAEEVIGGSIVFSTDRKTCGYNCNNQYKVNDFTGAMDYLKTNYGKMDERDLLDNLASMGLITAQ